MITLRNVSKTYHIRGGHKDGARGHVKVVEALKNANLHVPRAASTA
ncbi:hypothetical protein Q427_31445 [Halomonas sp. BC04]|nr:hypothetical protein Q427_31445 [Halomonas sp. BC04]